MESFVRRAINGAIARGVGRVVRRWIRPKRSGARSASIRVLVIRTFTI